jgi:DNA invertase Pin-like site-specific DNA recombinase
MNDTRTTSPAQKTTIYAHMIDKKNQLVKEMTEIENFINRISYDPVARSVIRSKFLYFNSLEGVAKSFHRSISTVKKHYNRGMNELLKIASKQDQKKDADQS